MLTSLTACASSSQGDGTTARKASADTGRIKVCLKNETGSAFEIGYWDAYLNESNQPITARDVTVAADATECVFSLNEKPFSQSEVNFYMWRDRAYQTTIRASTGYIKVSAPLQNTIEEYLFSGASEKKIDWIRGTLYGSFVNAPEAYTSGVAMPLTIRIYSLW